MILQTQNHVPTQDGRTPYTPRLLRVRGVDDTLVLEFVLHAFFVRTCHASEHWVKTVSEGSKMYMLQEVDVGAPLDQEHVKTVKPRTEIEVIDSTRVEAVFRRRPLMCLFISVFYSGTPGNGMIEAACDECSKTFRVLIWQVYCPMCGRPDAVPLQ